MTTPDSVSIYGQKFVESSRGYDPFIRVVTLAGQPVENFREYTYATHYRVKRGRGQRRNRRNRRQSLRWVDGFVVVDTVSMVVLPHAVYFVT